MSAPGSGLKQRQQQAWATGDFSKVGVASVIVGERLCEAVGLRAGERVVDVATGAGSAAISGARRSTEVIGVDFVPALLERARERARAEGVQRIAFQGAALSAAILRRRAFHFRAHVRPRSRESGRGNGACVPARRTHWFHRLDSPRIYRRPVRSERPLWPAAFQPARAGPVGR